MEFIFPQMAHILPCILPHIASQFDCCNSAITSVTELPLTSRYVGHSPNLGTTGRPNEKLHIKLCHCWYTVRRN